MWAFVFLFFIVFTRLLWTSLFFGRIYLFRSGCSPSTWRSHSNTTKHDKLAAKRIGWLRLLVDDAVAVATAAGFLFLSVFRLFIRLWIHYRWMYLTPPPSFPSKWYLARRKPISSETKERSHIGKNKRILCSNCKQIEFRVLFEVPMKFVSVFCLLFLVDSFFPSHTFH